MILSTQTEVVGERFGEEKALKFIAEAGFDAADYSMFCMSDDDNILNTSAYEKHVLTLKQIANDSGIFFNQAHSPFPSERIGDEKYNSSTKEKIKRSIEIAGILGVKNIVVHPTDYRLSSKKNLQKNYEYYKTLEPLCKEYNVKIAVENMWGWNNLKKRIIPNICSLADEFCEMVDMLDSQYFTACVDIGHAGLVGSTAHDLLRGLGHRVGCLHVHDNNFKDDNHMPPYFFDIDWSETTKALSDIDYKGDFTFEADRLFDNYPEELLPSAFKLLHDTGRYLISQIEKA